MTEDEKEKYDAIVNAFPGVGNGSSVCRSSGFGWAYAFFDGAAFRGLPVIEIVARFKQSLPDNTHLVYYEIPVGVLDSPWLHIATEDGNFGIDGVIGLFASKDWEPGKTRKDRIEIPGNIG